MVKLHPCPICKTLTDNEKYRPFCSKHCADVDLGRWFNGTYSIPGKKADTDDGQEYKNDRSEDE